MNNVSGRDCLFGFYEAVNAEAYFMALTDLLVTADGQYWMIMAQPCICAWCCPRCWVGMTQFFSLLLEKCFRCVRTSCFASKL